MLLLLVCFMVLPVFSGCIKVQLFQQNEETTAEEPQSTEEPKAEEANAEKMNAPNALNNIVSDKTTIFPLTEFTAASYIQVADLLPNFSFIVKAEKDEIYLNETVYDFVTQKQNLDIVYSPQLMEEAERLDQENENHLVTQTLEKIKAHQGFYLLTSSYNYQYGTVVVCKIDNTYYFLLTYTADTIERILFTNFE